MNKYFFLLVLVFALAGCRAVTDFIPVEADKAIGSQMATQVEYQGPDMLDENKYPEVYNSLEQIKKRLLASGNVKHGSDFDWKLKIIRDDSVQNAFCIAGGYIYVYTGLIKFLDNEAQLAGVLAHEIAHADARHTTTAILYQYGLGMIVSLFTGADPGIIAAISTELLRLSFSRSEEAEADRMAVDYMNGTTYDPRAVAGFFQKMIKLKKGDIVPAFLSTHPASEERIKEMMSHWQQTGSKKGELYADRYHLLQSKLP